jgi:hypothetical protein
MAASTALLQFLLMGVAGWLPRQQARGAALLAGLASGAWKVDDLGAMAPAVVPAGEPRTRSFEEKYVRFRALYDRLADWYAPGARPEVVARRMR